jgi:choice-of-anchor B domain-containing protein
MKKILLPLFTLCILSLTAQTPCNGGSAGPYSCDGYQLQSEISLGTLNASEGNDSWGWTDSSNGNEYAIVGLNNGTAFIDITNPNNPIYLGKLPTHTTSSSWRDIKTYNNHAYIVSEAGGHGMQVFDLTELRSVTSPPVTFSETAHFDEFGSAHNIVINEDTGYAYPVGAGAFNGGPIFVNIQDPTNPIGEGGYSMGSYSHDAQVVTYCGPDQDYIGSEILIGSNANEIVIVDISDKSNPVGISTINYSNVGYTHQGWFTEDQRYFLLGDEIDEQSVGFNTRTIVFDFNDLDNPQFHFEYYGPTAAIDHNGYVKGTKFYMANYRAGLRVIDVSDIENQNIVEEGFFDTYPGSDSASFSGAWSVYPYFDSGNIVISDINRGFLLVKAETDDNTAPTAICQDFTLELDANGEATLSADDIDNGSTDDSGTVYKLICETQFDCLDIGTVSIDLEVYDDFGNRDICTATLTIEDNMDPEIICPINTTVDYDSGQNFYTVPDYIANGSASVSDNCINGLIISQTPTPGTQLPEGNYNISFEAEDSSGNTSVCSFQLAVNTTLSISEVNFENNLRVFPNPSSNIVTIQSDLYELKNLQVIDVTGKIIILKESINSKKNVINIADLENGVYFLKVNNTVLKRIIKM